MSNAHKGRPPRSHHSGAKWYIGNELDAYGRKPADTTPLPSKASTRAVLVIIDAAGGVPRCGHQHRFASGRGREP
jgi:hypothetical protein